MPKQPLPSNKSAVLATWALPSHSGAGVKSACFAVARGGLPRLAAARHAACAHSWECRARPGVEKPRHGTFTASHRARKSQILSNIGRIATQTVATAGLPRRTAARHAACARSPGCTPRPDVGGARPAHARASTRVGNAAGGAGRPGGVDRAAQNHFLGVDQAARTSHSCMPGKLSDLDSSMGRRDKLRASCTSPHLSTKVTKVINTPVITATITIKWPGPAYTCQRTCPANN